jgi:hypothetical protein
MKRIPKYLMALAMGAFLSGQVVAQGTPVQKKQIGQDTVKTTPTTKPPTKADIKAGTNPQVKPAPTSGKPALGTVKPGTGTPKPNLGTTNPKTSISKPGLGVSTHTGAQEGKGGTQGSGNAPGKGDPKVDPSFNPKQGSVISESPRTVTPDKAPSNNGNAYGKNKTVEGRDFGQQRAAEARAQTKVTAQVAETKLTSEQQHVATAKSQIQAAKARVAQVKADPDANTPATKSWIEKMEAIILLAEQKVTRLQQQINTGLGLVRAAQGLAGLVGL